MTDWKRAVSAAALAGAAALLALPATPASAAAYVPISGAGSTWSQNALSQWATNVQQYGMRVNYQGTGSSDGRSQFRSGTVDFAVSEIPYGLSDNGVTDSPPSRGYAYMPIVAGGTSFMYNIKIGGARVTNLRMSGEVIAKIFTGAITRWNDPAIHADNPGLSLPARKIVPVVRSDGSGTTAQLTTWMSQKYPSIWNAYCAKAGRKSNPCGVTSNFPITTGFVGQSGSLGVSGYVAQSQNEGTITYVEYSYALNAGFPIAKMLNKAGYYVQPTPQYVAVGLLGARINEDASSSAYLTQILTGVYDNPDRRAYPLSSYSYMILPTKSELGFTTAKGNTLADFAYYFLCQGQQQAPILGYSPLPINLVQAGFKQVLRIPGVVPQNKNVKSCNNPTFSADGTNTLARTAPYPPACDKQGSTQCSTGTGGASRTSTKVNSSGGSSSGSGNNGGSGSGAGSGSGSGSGSSASAAAGSAVTVDPNTGQVVAAGQLGNTSGDANVSASAVQLSAATDTGVRRSLMALAVLLFAGVILGPPLLARKLAPGGRNGGRR